MEWLIDDINQRGPATTAADAEARRVPDFDGTAERQCGDCAGWTRLRSRSADAGRPGG